MELKRVLATLSTSTWNDVLQMFKGGWVADLFNLRHRRSGADRNLVEPGTGLAPHLGGLGRLGLANWTKLRH